MSDDSITFLIVSHNSRKKGSQVLIKL